MFLTRVQNDTTTLKTLVVSCKVKYTIACCAMLSRSFGCNSLQPHGLQPARLQYPWGFSRQEYWSELPCPPPGDLPKPRIELRSSAFLADSLPSELPGKPFYMLLYKASLVAQRVKRLSAMMETQVRSLGQEDPLEKEMATHSRILAWKIPWTEEPGRLQAIGSQRVGHD